MARQRLPIGLQDFRKIIENDFKYIDKTRYIYQICQSPGAYFLSRPRRFGKSITIATLQELYLGSKELFKGLWIEDKWDWSKTWSVIRLSLKDVNFEQLGLEKALFDRIEELSKNRNIPVTKTTARDQFRAMIQVLGQEQKIVVLIDEYDAPIIHYLGIDLEKAEENRELLKEFYTVLKEIRRVDRIGFPHWRQQIFQSGHLLWAQQPARPDHGRPIRHYAGLYATRSWRKQFCGRN